GLPGLIARMVVDLPRLSQREPQAFGIRTAARGHASAHDERNATILPAAGVRGVRGERLFRADTRDLDPLGPDALGARIGGGGAGALEREPARLFGRGLLVRVTDHRKLSRGMRLEKSHDAIEPRTMLVRKLSAAVAEGKLRRLDLCLARHVVARSIGGR